ncbi:hypothetical protein DUNSADRAFT_16843 [Dunaliella salina]|nr:hypothetical protein DUNSADRAFT_16843 [Dunaliella salina]|eukprot:KAF5828897.1 hypothetical protein DUNSADRAFT_16843 [Dunaliella salina]
MVQGFLVPVERLNSGTNHGVDGLITKVSLKDRNGQEFRIKFDYVNREPSACVTEEHNKEVERLIQEDKIHFLLGNTHFAFSEAKIANEAKKLTYHCCFETDELFKLDYPYVFGIANLADSETHQALTSMALEDSIAKLFIFYTKDFRYATQACENAVSYASSQLRRMSSKFQVLKQLHYTSANISSNPSFYDSVIVEEALHSGATAVLGCDNTLNGFAIARALGRIKHRLKAIFLTLSPGHPEFAEAVGPEITEHILTSSSWHPKMLGQGDSFFGRPEQYASAYQEATGSLPYFVPALASATVVSLLFAIESAFNDCEFIDPANLDADRLLYDSNAIRCPNSTSMVPGSVLPTTGYDMLLKSLSAQSMSTFLGNVEFNHFRRNIAHDPVVLQVQNGVPEIVLPLEQASQKLIMPIPDPAEKSEIGALEKDTFIVVVVVVIAGTLILLSALLLVFFFRRQHAQTIESLLTIEPEQLQIINLPVQLGTTWESGKARLRNTLVALEPLREIKYTSGEAASPNRSFLTTRQSHLADSKRKRSCGGESEAASSGHLTKPQILDDIDLESLQHEACTQDTCTTSRSVNGESLHGTSVHGGSFSQRRPATSPSMPPIHSVSTQSLSNNLPAMSLPSLAALGAPLVPKRDRPQSNALNQRQVLDLVWRSKNLQHPSVVPVVGVMWSLPGMPANIPVLVTECCELGSLTSVLDNQTMELDFLKQLDITKDLADALAYLHAQDKPYLRPALTSKLAGVQLNKLVRAKLRVPLTAFLSVQGNFDASHRHSGCLR